MLWGGCRVPIMVSDVTGESGRGSWRKWYLFENWRMSRKQWKMRERTFLSVRTTRAKALWYKLARCVEGQCGYSRNCMAWNESGGINRDQTIQGLGNHRPQWGFIFIPRTLGNYCRFWNRGRVGEGMTWSRILSEKIALASWCRTNWRSQRRREEKGSGLDFYTWKTLVELSLLTWLLIALREFFWKV